MTTREQIYRLIGRQPDDALPEAERPLIGLTAANDEGLPRFLAEAPWVDEPETEEERVAVAEAYEALERGEVFTLEAIKREFRL